MLKGRETHPTYNEPTDERYADRKEVEFCVKYRRCEWQDSKRKWQATHTWPFMLGYVQNNMFVLGMNGQL